MELSDPIVIAVGAVLACMCLTALLRAANRILQAISSVVLLVVVIWVVVTLTGIDLPDLPPLPDLTALGR